MATQTRSPPPRGRLPPGDDRWSAVQQELQRARGARRAVPFAAASTAAAGALVAFVAGSWRPGLAMLLPGALLLAFLAAHAVPRCPACGGGLWRRGERPGPAGKPRPTEVERSRRCHRCGATFA